MTALAAAGAILATACFGGTPPAASPAPAGGGVQVSTGSDVKATLSGDPGSGTKNVTITFGSVSAAGEVKAEPASTIPTLPAGFARTAAFDISTTATFDKATVCFDNDKVTSSSKLYHYKNVTWEDRTKSVNPPQICGEFTSFSPVAIVEGQAASPTPSPTTAPTATPTPTAAATATATPTAAATTAAPTAAATKTPTPTSAATKTPTPTVAVASPTPSPSPTPSATPTVAPTAPPVAAKQPCPTTGLVVCGTVTNASTGAPIGGVCVTIGPPIVCNQYTDAQGKYVINLSELAAPSGISWDFWFIKEQPSGAMVTPHQFPPYFERGYSGVIVVSGPVTKNMALTPK